MRDPRVKVELFISHASEDKDELVRPLAAALRRTGVTVWYDEYTLTAGDSLSRSIDAGLSVTQFGLVVLSRHFMSKPWPEYELRGLTAREISGTGKVIIPLWHGVGREDVLRFSPTLADKFALTTAGRELDDLVTEILRATRPDLADRLATFKRYLQAQGHGEIRQVPLETIAVLPPPETIEIESYIAVRALNVVNTLGAGNPRIVGDLMGFLTALAQDDHPEPELREWERMAAVYIMVTGRHATTSVEREELVLVLLALSFGDYRVLEDSQLRGELLDLVGEKWLTVSRVIQSDRVQFSNVDPITSDSIFYGS
ncbi:toll/interleukin-1 receptor domain-containing protein [Kribbella sp. NPDC056345]|uniref:toll/interleukin-1 receptor domain-containing protein n=1 Tax=Kribbella sp. NPDC056345 TaxID=3345789 RepID=UPI0035DD1732